MPLDIRQTSPPMIQRIVGTGVCLLALFLSTATAVAQSEPSFSEPTAEQTEKLRSGEILIELDQDDDVVSGWLLALVQDPIDDVVPLLARCWEYSKWQETVVDTRLERRIRDNSYVCSGKTLTPFPARDRHGHFQVQYGTREVDGTRSFVYEYEYLKGTGNLEEVFGYWLLIPYGKQQEHTLAKHAFSVNLGSRIPTFLIRWVLNRNVPELAHTIRQHLGEHRTEKPYWDDHDYD